MKAIRITSCRDGHMWYAPFVGRLAVYRGYNSGEFLSREPAGYTNIILGCDGELIEVSEEEWNRDRLDSSLETKNSS